MQKINVTVQFLFGLFVVMMATQLVACASGNRYEQASALYTSHCEETREAKLPGWRYVSSAECYAASETAQGRDPDHGFTGAQGVSKEDLSSKGSSSSKPDSALLVAVDPGGETAAYRRGTEGWDVDLGANVVIVKWQGNAVKEISFSELDSDGFSYVFVRRNGNIHFDKIRTTTTSPEATRYFDLIFK